MTLFNQSSLIKSAPFSPIIIAAAFVFPDTTVGIIEASTTLKFFIPRTLKKQNFSQNKKKTECLDNNRSRGAFERKSPYIEFFKRLPCLFYCI